MKLSRVGVARGLLALGLALGLAGGGLWGAPVRAQESTYQPWSGYQQETDQKSVTQLVDRLRALIKKAETARAADPKFLSDLTALADQYSTGGGKGYVFLTDNFKDGNDTANPTWKISAGQWAVETGGANFGLVSKIRQGQNVDALLGAILGVQTQPTSTQQEYASIYTAVKYTNAFVIKIKLTSKDLYGGLNIAPYQGASGQNAYRLVYQPNNAKGLMLQRVSGNKTAQIAAFNGMVRLEDGKPHDLMWSRDSAGKMIVTVDGQTALTATDTKIAGNMEGLLLVNVGGSYWLREVKIEGN